MTGTNPTNIGSDFLRNEGRFFQSLAQAIPQMFSIVDAESYRINYINRVEPGYSVDEVIGKEIFDFMLPEHIAIYREKIQQVKLTGKTEVLEIGFLSFQFPEGVTWCLTTIVPIYAENGSLDCLMILSEDISESKNLEIENNNQSERLKAIINNTEDLICSIDLNYNLIEFNTSLAKSVRNGYNVELKPGMAILDYIDPRKHSHLREIYMNVTQGDIIYDIESYGTTHGIVFIESSFHPIYNTNQAITGISIFAKDISERIKAEQSIKIALKEKEVLLAEIHHRIKNNLAMVSSLLQLKEMNISNMEAKEALSSSRKRIKTTALIHELLYRNESFHAIDLKDFIVELFQLLNTNSKIQLLLEGDNPNLNLNTALPLGLILNELMLNSFKYSYADQQIGQTSIHIKSDPASLSIEYCDCQGHFPEGIDFKNSSTTGLTLLHTFAEQLNGSIDLINNKPPKYSIKIPVHATNS